MNYKIKKYNNIIFPKESLGKIKDILSTNSINHQIGHGVKYIYINNNYQYFKELAKEKLMIEDRIDLIIKKIEQLHGDELRKLLNNMENILNE